MSYLGIRARLVCALMLCAGACGPEGSGNDDTEASGSEASGVSGGTQSSESGTDESGSTSTESSTSTGTETSGETSGETGGETGGGDQCEPNANSTCTTGFDCTVATCGGLSSLDDDGCMRPRCIMDNECDTTERCYRPIDFGGCESSGQFCMHDAMGACTCASDPDCGGGFCIPAELYP